MFNDSTRNPLRDTNHRTCSVMVQLHTGGVDAQRANGLRQFGQLIAVWRHRQGLSRTAFAAACHLPPQEIAWLEWGLLTDVEVESRLPELSLAIGDPQNVLGSAFGALVQITGAPLIQQETI